MAELTDTLANRVASRMRRDGFECIAFDVQIVYETGTHDDAALASAIITELQELGLL